MSVRTSDLRDAEHSPPAPASLDLAPCDRVRLHELGLSDADIAGLRAALERELTLATTPGQLFDLMRSKAVADDRKRQTNIAAEEKAQDLQAEAEARLQAIGVRPPQLEGGGRSGQEIFLVLLTKWESVVSAVKAEIVAEQERESILRRAAESANALSHGSPTRVELLAQDDEIQLARYQQEARLRDYRAMLERCGSTSALEKAATINKDLESLGTFESQFESRRNRARQLLQELEQAIDDAAGLGGAYLLASGRINANAESLGLQPSNLLSRRQTIEFTRDSIIRRLGLGVAGDAKLALR